MSLSRPISRSVDRRTHHANLCAMREAEPKTTRETLALAGNTSRRVRRLARRMFNAQLEKFTRQGVALTPARKARLVELKTFSEDALRQAPPSETFLRSVGLPVEPLGTVGGRQIFAASALDERDWLRKLVARPTKRTLRQTELHLARMEGQLKRAEG